MNDNNPSRVSPTLLVSLATAPFILGLSAIEHLTENLIEIGRASEEVFRGDRLPILNFPEPIDREEPE